MYKIIRLIRQWSLLASIATGTAVYLAFSHVAALEPVGDAVGPRLVALMPYIIFVMLYASFCKIELGELRLHRWHFCIQAIRVALTLLAVAGVRLAGSDAGARMVMTGLFVCVISPTGEASSATGRFGTLPQRGSPHLVSRQTPYR